MDHSQIGVELKLTLSSSHTKLDQHPVGIPQATHKAYEIADGPVCVIADRPTLGQLLANSRLGIAVTITSGSGPVNTNNQTQTQTKSNGACR